MAKRPWDLEYPGTVEVHEQDLRDVQMWMYKNPDAPRASLEILVDKAISDLCNGRRAKIYDE